MRILVVGGTGFLGSSVARAALVAGYDMTVMTRSGHNVPAGAKVLIADREENLPDLSGAFDVVVDTCGYTPDMITRLGAAIGDAHYIFVSSISVYDDMSVPQFDEAANAPRATEEDLTLASNVPVHLRGTAAPYGAAYGRLKRSSEVAAQATFGPDCALIRLGLIVGPEDYTDRFTWWVRRCDAGGDFAVPGPKDRIVQIIDVRDAAAFILRLAKTKAGGTFHVTGRPIKIEQMLAAIQIETGVALRLRYVPLRKFTDAGLRHWTDLPLILPDDPAFAQMLNVSITKALAAGLTLRPLGDTVQAVLDWDRQQRDVPLTCGMTPEDEAQLGAF